MKSYNWKIFDKRGSNLNQYIDSFLNIEFTDAQNSIGAEAYAITDPSSVISDVIITNSGWQYGPNTTGKLTFAFSDYENNLEAAEASINFIDVSIFNPTPSISQGIGSVDIDISTAFIYPSVIYTSAVFMKPVSIELIETEHLAILEQISDSTYIRPYDSENPLLVFRFSDGDSEIRLFEVEEDTQNLTWTDEIIFDTSAYVPNTPIMINIGFKSSEEGVFERKLRAYHRINGEDYQIAEILVNSQSIGKDERFDTLSQNFGLPNTKNIPHLFKEADLNEEMPDWELLNYKGKHLVLEHDKIMPYIGSYKALINAIKWLGYEDIKVKEWFRNVKENTKLSLYVPYEAKDRAKTILSFSPEERKNLKKLNQLSLIYCITQETGEIDEWGTPLIEECYEYNINEILVKLKALKEWLEKNIIGVNARIIDVTGEGIYIERFRNFIYATQDKGSRALYSQSLTPVTIDETSELVRGEASIGLTLMELNTSEVNNYEGLRIRDFLQYYWDPSNGAFDPADASDLWWDPSTIAVGSSFKFPLNDLFDVQWRLSKENIYGVITNDFVSKPLFIYENEIRFHNIFDSSAIFYDVSANIDITIESGYLRDPSNDIWTDSIAYSIYPNIYIRMDGSTTKTLTYDASYAVIYGSGLIYMNDTSIAFNDEVNPVFFVVDSSAFIISETETRIQSPLQNGYTLESSTGDLWNFHSEFSLQTDTSSFLQYAFDDNYKVPLLSINGYKWVDSNGAYHPLERSYYLDILDGNISMSKFIREPSSLFGDPSIFRKEEHFINFNYDTSIDEQKITHNVIYNSPRAPLYLYDPSTYYHIGETEALVIDNSIYVMYVNHIGPYNIEIFGWDGQNNLYRNFLREEYEVWTKFPTIWSYLDTSCQIGSSPTICPSAYLLPADISALSEANLYPIFDRQVPLQGLTLEKDLDDKYYINIPSISYYVDNPDPGSIARFYNLTERVINRVGDTFYIDPDYQQFNVGDDINLVLFNLGKYYFVNEVSGNISSSGAGTIDITGIPSDFITNEETQVYLLNETKRTTYNPVNDLINNILDIDISSYYFRTNQLVGMIIDDVCTGYSWGSAFRVMDSSTIDSSFGRHHQLEGNIPEFILNNPDRYTVTAKHAFSSFADFNINVNTSTEISNNFHVYLEDQYYHQYYLDSTFVYVNVLFDQERILDQWYDPSTDGYLVTGAFYPYTKAITIDSSTLVILDTYFDPSTYMLNQQNIWTLSERESGDIVFRVYNKSVPYIFKETGVYDILVESYDKFGNLKKSKFEGLITVK